MADHLELKSLAVNFDYLMYQISNRISTLADQTHGSVTAKVMFVENDYLQQQLRLDGILAEIDACQCDCNALEALFAKLDQLYAFVDDFRSRLAVLEAAFASP